MKPEDQNRFREIMAGLGDYYKEKITKTLMTVFWEDFEDCNIDDFAKAVSSHRKDPDQGMFFPKTANLIKQLHGTGKQQARSIEGKAELAWAGIIAHLTTWGPYQTYKSKDGVSLAAFHAVGGMSKLSTASNDDLVWIKKEFVSMYETYENTPIENLPQNILGLADLQKHKLEQKGKLTDILSIATDMIDKCDSESSETSPEAMSEEERKKLGQGRGAELREIMGMPQRETESKEEISKPTGEGVKVISHDIEKEAERRRQVLESAKANLNKGAKSASGWSVRIAMEKAKESSPILFLKLDFLALVFAAKVAATFGKRRWRNEKTSVAMPCQSN